MNVTSEAKVLEPELPEELKSVFKAAEARHLTTEELDLYRRMLPGWAGRADAAQACYDVEVQVVDDTIEAIFQVYPYADYHALHAEKCPRDVTNVSTYAIQSMLMGERDWFKDKLLLWLKTILQSFEFPERSQPRETVLFGNDEDTEIINSLPTGRQSLYETYLLLDRNYEQMLEAHHYELLKPHVEIARHLLSGE